MSFVFTVTTIAAVLFIAISVGFTIWYLQHGKRNTKVIIGVISTLMVFVFLATFSTYTVAQHLLPKASLDVSPTRINITSSQNFLSGTPSAGNNPFQLGNNGAICMPMITGGKTCQVALHASPGNYETADWYATSKGITDLVVYPSSGSLQPGVTVEIVIVVSPSSCPGQGQVDFVGVNTATINLTCSA